MRAEPVEFRTSDGLTIRGEAYGSAGPLALFAHGAGQTRQSWRAVARDQAARGWRTVTLDLRGHGASDWDSAGDYTLERYAQDLAGIARDLGGGVHHVGASLGGNAAIPALARLAPEAFRALVLVDVVPQVDMGGVAEVLGFMAEHLDDGFADLDAAAAAVARYRGQEPRKLGPSSGLARMLKPRADGRLVWHWDPRFVSGQRTGRLTPAYQARLVEDLRAIRQPLLLLRGLRSNLVTDAAEAAFRATVPQAQVWHVGGAGHMVVGDANTQFAADLDRFLSSIQFSEGEQQHEQADR